MSKTVLVTGAQGFLGKNLVTALERTDGVGVRSFTQSDALTALPDKVNGVDLVFHLAGINRPESDDEFEVGNAGLTREPGRLRSCYFRASIDRLRVQCAS